MSWMFSQGQTVLVRSFFGRHVIALTLLILMSLSATAFAAPKTFGSPDEAVDALIGAIKNKDLAAITAILGEATEQWIVSGDAVQDEEARIRFVTSFDEKREIERDGEDKAVLVVGIDGYPFPIPVIKGADGWAFDPEQGREEILDRRIGGNELNTIQVLLAIAEAQREYASVDRNGDGLMEYAAKFRSSEGARDGLYWATSDDEPLSPLGPLVAEATSKGYKPQTTDDADAETNAYFGYRFKLLDRQGENAPDGPHDYLVDGKMVGGFGVLAYPAKYGASGVMTFAINHVGAVYETDLGPETETMVAKIVAFDPGPGWEEVKPE